MLVRAWQAWRDAGPNPVLRKPTVLQFPVNDICNSRCQMCRIWEQKRDEEISPEQLGDALDDPFFDAVENVGLNGGEPTLRRDLTKLAEVLMDRLPRLHGLSLITNAIREERVIAAIDQLGHLCRARGKHLDVMVSLDGVGEVHDKVRAVPGNFESAMKVLDHVRASPWVNSCRIGCTIIADNVFEVENVLALAKERGVYARFRLGVPHPRLYSAHLRDPFALDAESVFHVAAFLDTLILEYEHNDERRAFYASLRDQLTEQRPRAAGCAWRNHGATLGPRGEFSYCAVASPVLGNVREAAAAGLYWGGREVLEGILRDSCAGCRHDYEGVGNRRVLARIWARRVLRRLPEPVIRPLRSVYRELTDWRAYWRAPAATPGAVNRAGVNRVLFAGWYGTETLGDRAILAGLCALLKEVCPQVIIEVASLNPYVTRETVRLMPELGVSRIVALSSAIDEVACGRFSAVAVAGGPLMTPVREVIALKNLLKAAARSGARTALLGCGLGPIEMKGARNAAIRRMVRTVDVCVLRDAASIRMARDEYRRPAETGQAVDPAFFWVNRVVASRSAAVSGGRLVVALALREWMTAEYAADLNERAALEIKGRFEHELLRMIRRFKVVAPTAELVPVCMHTLSQGGDDRWFFHRLLADDPLARTAISWRRRSPKEELALLQAAAGVVAMRFHSVVFALGLGKPLLAIDYTRGGKIAALLHDTANSDRLVGLEGFDGEVAADMLLSEIAAGVTPRAVELSEAKETYRRSLGEWLGAVRSR